MSTVTATLKQVPPSPTPAELRFFGADGERVVCGLFQFTPAASDYLATGYLVDFSKFFPTQVDAVFVYSMRGNFKAEYVPGTALANGAYPAATGRILVRVASTGAEAADATDLSGQTIAVMVFGRV